MEYIAHIDDINTTRIQNVSDHCVQTAINAAKYAEKFQMSELAYIQGLMHDAGKLCRDFTEYIRHENKICRGEIDHSYAGAKYIYDLSMKSDNALIIETAYFIARTIISHHGLHDWINTDGNNYFTERISKDDRYTEICSALPSVVSDDEIIKRLEKASKEYLSMKGRIVQILKRDKISECAFYLGLAERFMQSVIVDADRTDTADFMSGLKTENEYNIKSVWEAMSAKMNEKCAEFGKKNDKISKQRMNISDRCAYFSNHRVNICRLIVPTGGGKTLSSLRFAIEYCEKYDMERIFYIAPFMSILEQNSDIIRDISGDENLLEHHSNIMQEIENSDELNEYEIRTDKWDKPVIATTLVQFLNTFYSDKLSSVRRMHRLSKAVIIIDEVQSIPSKCVNLFNLAMNFISGVCGSTVILCSATQPCFEKTDYPVILDEQSSMTDDYTNDFVVFQRTRIISKIRTNGYTFEEAAEFCFQKYEENGNLLVVVNTKASASKIFNLLNNKISEDNIPPKILHLSTNMCAANRTDTLVDMKKCLKNKQKLICVTTQLIEAGVDISFRCVVRSLAGLDNAAQAAGRCNRNGEYDCCDTYIIDIIDEKLGRLKEINQSQDISRQIIGMNKYDDLLDVGAMGDYFLKLYAEQSRELSYNVTDLSVETTLVNLLSINSDRVSLKNHKMTPFYQAFKTAGSKFVMIDNNTQTLIVPYNDEAKMLIADFDSDLRPDKIIDKLRKSQKYTVEIYSGMLSALQSKNAVYYSKAGVLVLKEGFYDNQYGIKTDGCESILMF